MKQFLLALSFLICVSYNSFSQSDVPADGPVSLNGIDYGYSITNVQSKEDYERYELSFYAINKSGCHKFIMLQSNNNLFSSNSYNIPNNSIAEFTCINATGKRLTSTTAKINAKMWFIPLQEKAKDSGGKEITTTRNVQAGFIFRNGETITNKVVILTPKGEKPQVKVMAVSNGEM